MERRVLERLVRLFVSAGPLGALLFICATAALSLAAPQTAQAQTCTINWGTVPYRSTGNTYVMSSTVNAAVLAACDTRYPAVDSGLTPSPQSGSSTGNGTWSGVTNPSDNTLTFSPHARWAGPDTFTVFFCNAPGCPGANRRTATVNVTIANPTLALTPSLGNGTVAAAYSQTLTASGSASPYAFSVVSGALPPGLSLGVVSNPDATTSTVALAGTPTAGGTFNFTIRATDNSIGTGPFTIDQAYTVTIAPATISVTTASVPNGTQNSAYTSTPLAATGGTSPYSWTVSAGALPTGMSLSTAGVLSGTPTQSGNFNFTARALDSSTGTGPYFGTRGYSFSIAAVAAVANPVSVTAPYGSTNNPVTLNITGGTATSVAVGTQATNGTATAAGTSITYTPTAGYAGPDSFTYTATNAAGTSAPATVTVTVSPPTLAISPTSLPNGTTGVAYSQSTTGSGGAAPYVYSISAGALPAGLGINPTTGQISGTPTGTGLSNFTVRIQDSSTGTGPFSTTRPYSITIVTPNPPIANAVSATVAFGSTNNPVTLNITGGAATSVAVGTQATNGTATAAGTSITYTPVPGYFGPDSFTYTATNADGTSAPATVTMTVNPQPPVANAASAAVAFGSTNNPITLNLTGGAPVSVAVGTQATNGTAVAVGTSITYTPNPGYFGPDSFTYTATNAGGTSAPATVTMTVNPQPPVANAASATVAFGSTNNPITLNVTGGPAASVAVGTQATNGTATAVGASITYTPNPGYFGPDSFTYTATNAAGTSAPATVTLTVNPQPPTANAVSLATAQDSTNNPVTLNITGGAPVSVAVGTQATNGTATAVGTSITYTPNAGYFGPDSFTYSAANTGGTSAPATVAVTVNQTPTTVSPVSATVAFNSGANPITLNITGLAASVAIATQATNGTAAAVGTSITYTPNTNYAGPDSFTYTATNTAGTSAPATVTITVSPPAPPTAGPVSLTVAANSAGNPVTLALGGGVTLGVATPTLPTHGSVSVAGASITYTPTAGYSGSDSFTYTATNPGGTTAPATVTVTVSPPTLALSAIALSGQVGVGYSETITASLGTAPYSFVLAAGSDPLPTGLSLTSGGVLSGTPSAAGPRNLIVEATDAYGATGTRAYALAVAAPTIVITSPSAGALPDGAVGSSYSQTFTAMGGFGARTFALTAGALPAGMTLNSAGVLSGTPTVAGAFSFQITVSDSAPTPFSSAPVAYSLTVTAPTITVSPASLPAATTAAAYSQTITASGGVGGTYAYAVTAGALPAGLSLSSGGALSGAPTAVGPFNFTVTATDTLGFTGSRAYTLTVANPIIAMTAPASGALPGVAAGSSYSQTFTAAGGQGPWTFALGAGALPAGVSLSSAGVLSGAPTVAGTFNFTVVASDSSPAPGPFASTPTAYSVTVTAPTITVSPASLPAATTAAAYSQTITASGGVGGTYAYSLSAGALPIGVTLSSGGVLSGAPGAAGTFNFTVTATDTLGFTGSRAYTLTVANPTITVTAPPAGALPGAQAGVAYSQTFTATGGQGAKTFALTAGALPVGMAFSSAGVLSGTPTTAGTFNFTLVASDSSPAPGPFVSTPVAYSLTVTAPTITVSPTSLPAAVTAAAYNQTITASGGVGAYTYSLAAGSMPVGMAFSSAGVLSGAPGAAGTFSFTIVATDSLGFTGSRSYALTVTDPTIVVTAPAAGPLPGAQAGVAYSQTFTATGGQGAKTFALTAGALPPGVALSSAGVLSGTPTAAGTFNFTVAASDSSPAPGPFVSTPVAYSLTVTAPTIVLAPAAGALPVGLRTVAYSQLFSASGGTGPYGFTITAGALPPGLALASGGTLSGTPTAAGSFGFTVTATDALGFTQAAAYTLAIGTPVPVVQPQTATVVGGQSVTINVTTGATGVDFTSVSVVSPPSHGAAVVQGLTVVYTANGAYSGPDSFTYTVNNAGGASAPGTVTITVNPAVVAAPPKTATILAGQMATVELTDGATGAPFTAAAVVSVGPAGAGTATIAPRTGAGGVQLYDLVFTPADAFTGQATVLYTLSNAFATSAPGTVTITVEPRPDPSLDPDVRGVASSQVTAARRFASAQIDNFQQRLQDLHDGDNRSSSGLSLNLGQAGDEDRDPRQALRRQLDPRGDRLDPGALGDGRERDLLGLDLWSGRAEASANSAGAGALNAAPAAGTGGGRDPVGFWAAGAVDWGRQDATGQRDSRFTTHGVTAGVDVRVSDDLIVGGGLGYGEDKTRIGDNGSVSNGTAVSGAVYASWSPGGTVYLDGLIGFSDLEFDSRRWVQGLGGQPDGFAEGRRAGDVLFGSAAIGRLIRRDSWSGDFYARLDAHDITLEAFTETGGGLAALVWNETRQRSVSANLGVNWRWRADMRQRGSIEPSARLEWSYEFEDVGAQGVRYADWRASPTYWIPLDGWSRHALNLDIGADWSLSDRLMLGLRYRGLLGDAASSHGGEFRLRYGW